MKFASQFHQHVQIPTLHKIGLYSTSADILLMGTAAHESGRFQYLRQVNGPALGLFQIEPFTHSDLWKNWIAFRSDIRSMMYENYGPACEDHQALIYNMGYSVAIARLIYRRVRAPLPSATNLVEIAQYWKDHYNTHLGRGTVEKWIADYRSIQ